METTKSHTSYTQSRTRRWAVDVGPLVNHRLAKPNKISPRAIIYAVSNMNVRLQSDLQISAAIGTKYAKFRPTGFTLGLSSDPDLFVGARIETDGLGSVGPGGSDRT